MARTTHYHKADSDHPCAQCRVGGRPPGGRGRGLASLKGHDREAEPGSNDGTV